MAVEKKSRTIDGLEITITQLPYMRAARLLARLGRLAAPAIARVEKVLAGGLGDINVGAMLDAVSALLLVLSEEDIQELHEILLKDSAEYKGKPLWGQMDFLLAGQVATGMKILAFALEVNYGDFFAALSEAASKPQVTEKPGAAAQAA